MGLVNGHLKAILTSQQNCVKCIPQKPYQPFPEHLHESQNGGLVLEIRSLPSQIARREVSQDAFWWVDVQFLPYNDAELVVAATPYTPRQFQAWVAAKGVPHGRIIVFDTRHRPIKGYVLTGTESTMYPKIQPHPLGEAVGYAGKGELRVDSLQNEVLFSKLRDMGNRSHRFCAFSPNGASMAVLTHCSRMYYLEVHHMGTFLSSVQKMVACHKLCPGFMASGTHNDHVECKWSPDGSRLAASSSRGKLFVVDKGLSHSVVNIFPCLVEGNLSSAGSFDFDPRVGHSVMAVGTSEGLLAIIQTDVSDQGDVILQELDTEENINCVQYNQDGSSIAVSFSSFCVSVYSTKDLSLHHTIDMSESCSHHLSLYQNEPFPLVQRLSFSYDGRHLATSSCDGYVRVWSVPRLLTLQEWCRKRILQNMPVVMVRKCSLPQKMKQFLLSEFF
ncbi:uncharacterized protein LOC143284233 [Babylonia areolata]|uniref:uncharacterized protein LOC143284233 n=1 Tax=Babylonia areolata TaxID=304850 RepID=UPI003FD50AEF